MSIKSLDALAPADRAVFGAKACSLAEVMRAGFRVPKGLVISLDTPADCVRAELSALLWGAPAYAIRSSFTDEDDGRFSKAGHYESRLNVSDPLAVILPLLDREGAVIIQEMIASDFGGVIFSATADSPNQIAIELCQGLNTGVTRGDGAVSRIILDNHHALLEQHNFGCMTELVSACKALERHFGWPVDVEWCVKDNTLYILQARPITGLSTEKDLARIKQDELERLQNDVARNGFGIWTDFSVGDMFQSPSPLFLDLLNHDQGPNWAVRRVYEAFGLKVQKQLCAPLFVTVGGRAFIQVANYFEFLFPNSRVIPGAKGIALRPRGTYWATFKHLLALAALPFRFRHLRRSFSSKWSAEKASLFEDPLLSEDAQRLSTPALWKRFDTLIARLNEHAIEAHLMSDVISGLSQGILRGLLKALFGADASDWEFRLTTGLDGNFNSECTLALQDLAEGRLSLADFMRDYGYRGSPDWDFAAPRWCETPDDVLKMAKDLHNKGNDPRTQWQKQKALRESAENGLVTHLNAKVHRRLFRNFVLRQLRYVQTYSPLREQTQALVYRFIKAIREVILLIAERNELDDAVFELSLKRFMLLRDLPTVPSLLKVECMQSRYERTLARRLFVPHQFTHNDLSLALFDPPALASSEVLKGTKVSGGVCIGRARVIDQLSPHTRFGADEIVVTRFADPSQAAQFLSARGLVLEQGSVYSHMAIVAREFGLPTLVNVPLATHLIKDGQPLRLDAHAGEVALVNNFAP